MLEKAVKECGSLETLGDVVHNEQVMQKLNKIGVKVIHNIDEINSTVVAISSHGVTPQMESEIKAHKVKVIDTTCPFVRRAQTVARKFAEAGLNVIVYGDADHTEVKGILGWSQERGIATLDSNTITLSLNSPYRIGCLAQTTQIPENYTRFVKDMVDLTLTKDAEIRVTDTICHDIRKRQSNSFDLSKKVDLMLVIGGRSSANTQRLRELCSTNTETHLISESMEIDPSWLKDKKHIGITSGTSTSEQAINEVVEALENS
jgi:4-hydroxy-3-methylbut-2-en-1-yl diphosphate reductase